jgi:hypothetical protein
MNITQEQIKQWSLVMAEIKAAENAFSVALEPEEVDAASYRLLAARKRLAELKREMTADAG